MSTKKRLSEKTKVKKESRANWKLMPVIGAMKASRAAETLRAMGEVKSATQIERIIKKETA